MVLGLSYVELSLDECELDRTNRVSGQVLPYFGSSPTVFRIKCYRHSLQVLPSFALDANGTLFR